MAGTTADRRLLKRYDLPFGSSIFIAAVKHAAGEPPTTPCA